MNNTIILGSLAMDLKRVAISYFKGSNRTADIFLKEALKRKREIRANSVKPYIRNILKKIADLKSQDKEKAAEDALMYSTILQNATLTINNSHAPPSSNT